MDKFLLFYTRYLIIVLILVTLALFALIGFIFYLAFTESLILLIPAFALLSLMPVMLWIWIRLIKDEWED
jgi:hypothetical protein